MRDPTARRGRLGHPSILTEDVLGVEAELRQPSDLAIGSEMIGSFELVSEFGGLEVFSQVGETLLHG